MKKIFRYCTCYKLRLRLLGGINLTWNLEHLVTSHLVYHEMAACLPCVEEEELVLPPGTLTLLPDRTSWVNARIFVSGGVIKRVDVDPLKEVDLSKATGFLTPGLMDTHIHAAAVTAGLSALTRYPPSYIAIAAAVELQASLKRGFTCMRDAGGADHGVARAAAEGLFGVAPRLLFAGHALSQVTTLLQMIECFCTLLSLPAVSARKAAGRSEGGRGAFSRGRRSGS